MKIRVETCGIHYSTFNGNGHGEEVDEMSRIQNCIELILLFFGKGEKSN
jgi:hypothetical protein